MKVGCDLLHVDHEGGWDPGASHLSTLARIRTAPCRACCSGRRRPIDVGRGERLAVVEFHAGAEREGEGQVVRSLSFQVSARSGIGWLFSLARDQRLEDVHRHVARGDGVGRLLVDAVHVGFLAKHQVAALAGAAERGGPCRRAPSCQRGQDKQCGAVHGSPLYSREPCKSSASSLHTDPRGTSSVPLRAVGCADADRAV